MIYRAVLIGVAGALLASTLGGRPELRMGVTIAAGLCVAFFRTTRAVLSRREGRFAAAVGRC